MTELIKRPLFNPAGDTDVLRRRMIGGNTTNLNDFNNMTDVTINAEIEDSLKNNYKAQKTGDPFVYYNTDIYRTGKEITNRNVKVLVLCKLFNIITLGKIIMVGLTSENYKLIANMLQKYGLEKYKNDVFNRLKQNRYCDTPSESCSSLSNTIKKMGHEIGDDDSISIMRFGADVLKHCGVSNFDDLAKKIR